MKKPTKRVLYILLFFVWSNFFPLQGVLIFFCEGFAVFPPLDHYITADKKFVHGGHLSNAPNNVMYLRYLQQYPNADHTLFRVESMRWYRFWRWRDYLTDVKWKAPYIETDWALVQEIFQKIYVKGELYSTEEERKQDERRRKVTIPQIEAENRRNDSIREVFRQQNEKRYYP